MADFEKHIIFGMNRAKKGHLMLQEEISTDNYAHAAFLEAFESYQDADVVFHDKLDELTMDHQQHNVDVNKIAIEAAIEVMRDRHRQREFAANESNMKLHQAIHSLKNLEDDLRIKEGVMRSASARMIASMNIARDKEEAAPTYDFELPNFDLNPSLVEFKVARKMQQNAQIQAIAATKDFDQALEMTVNMQQLVDELEHAARTSYVLSYAAKYVAENAVFKKKKMP